MKLEFESIEEYIEFIQTMENRANTGNIDLVKMELKEIMSGVHKEIIDLRKQVEKLQTNEPEIQTQNVTINYEKLYEPKPKSKKTIRKYTQNNYDMFPQIKAIKPNGKFILGKGKLSKYTMYDILKLKKHLPDLTLNWVDLGELIGVSHFTAKNLGCAIEDGFFDKWFDEWSEMQSKLPTRKNFVENNPEKRKALMGMG